MKTYLFDFDGTLVDSMPKFVASVLRILDEENIKYGDDIIKIVTPLGVLGTAKYFITLGSKLTVEEIVKKMKVYMSQAYLYEIEAKPTVIETIKALKEKGADLNILTASPHVTLDPCLKRIGIYDLFTNVWSCDDFNTTKGDPEIYKMAAKKLGKKVNEILFVDDNLNADKTAKAAGMKVSGIYDDSSKEMIEEIKQVADFYAYEFKDILNFDF